MGYYVDLKKISIEKYKEILKSTELIPSWSILEENIDDNLDVLISQNLNNLDELLTVLNSKEKIIILSEKSSLSEIFLEVLKRVVNGYRQKPNRLKDFTDVTEDTIGKLDKLGIKNTLKLYDKILTPEKRKELSKNAEIDENEILRLSNFCDLSRIRWVNHTFAYVLLESGYDSVEKVAKADYKILYRTIKQLNDKRKIYKAHIGERDMKMIIDFSQELDIEIEY